MRDIPYTTLKLGNFGPCILEVKLGTRYHTCVVTEKEACHCRYKGHFNDKAKVVGFTQSGLGVRIDYRKGSVRIYHYNFTVKVMVTRIINFLTIIQL